MFHYVREQELKNCLLNVSNRYTFSHHVIVCIFAEQDSPLIGLRNFVLPLRASNYHYEELKDIVLIGNPDFLSKEWKSICNFPKIHIFPVRCIFVIKIQCVFILNLISTKKRVHQIHDQFLEAVTFSFVTCA